MSDDVKNNLMVAPGIAPPTVKLALEQYLRDFHKLLTFENEAQKEQFNGFITGAFMSGVGFACAYADKSYRLKEFNEELSKIRLELIAKGQGKNN